MPLDFSGPVYVSGIYYLRLVNQIPILQSIIPRSIGGTSESEEIYMDIIGGNISLSGHAYGPGLSGFPSLAEAGI